MKNKQRETLLQKELNELIAPYNKHWKEWTESNHCFLTVQQVQVIHRVQEKGRLTQAAADLGLPVHLVRSIYSRTKRKLRSYRSLYAEWADSRRTKRNAGKSKLMRLKAEFLNASFQSRYYPEKWSSLLTVLGSNMAGLLSKYDEKALRRWLGKKRMDELKTVLKENRCIDLLSK